VWICHGVIVSAYEVDGLPQMDTGFVGGTCDPYVLVNFAGISLKTPHFKVRLPLARYVFECDVLIVRGCFELRA